MTDSQVLPATVTGIGAVPETCTVLPTTTARENPATGSNGECPEIKRRSISTQVSRG